MNKVVIIGPAHPLRGGLASFNERLARQFQQQGWQASIFTFSLQYPGFLFPGTTQYSSEPAPADIDIHVCINSINPISWLAVGNRLKKLAPDIIVVRYWLPFMGPALGTILRLAKSNAHTKVVCIADNILPHEKRPGDQQFTQYFIKPVDGFITMSDKVMNDLRTFTQKPAVQVVHPLYDNFGAIVDKQLAKLHLGIDPDTNIILFFGFIRQYKGLDLLLEAMHLLQQQRVADPSIQIPILLVAGEFYEDRKTYDELVAKYQLSNLLILKTEFIADSEVKYYLSAADFVIQPYRNATQSGVTPLAYHFEKPMLVTNVGGLPQMVPHKQAGIVTEPTPIAIAEGILQLYQLGEGHFLPYLIEEKKKYSWDNLVAAIRQVT